MQRILTFLAVLVVSACALLPEEVVSPLAGAVDQPPLTLDPTPPPPPPPDARTAEEFDTTSVADREAALLVPASATDVELGTTIVSLGPPTDPGIWLETALVDRLVMGRVDYPAQGTSVALELRPSGGAPGSGSQISLAAMRLLEIPLTALAEVTVFGPPT